MPTSDATTPESPAPGTTAPLADRYELGESVGYGAMGTVHRAHDRRLDRPVAIKLLRSGLGGLAPDGARFEREARAAAGLSHPNIVAVYDFHQDDVQSYLVMELLPGTTLADQLRGGQLDGDSARRIGADLCAALSCAHGAGVVHRDIKPANVLVTDDGSYKLADFGIAKVLDGAADETAAGMVLGTAAYLAPERLRGAAATPASDIYALGVVLRDVLAARPEVDPSMQAVVDRATADDPAERFPDADAMGRAIEATSPSDLAPTAAVAVQAEPTEVYAVAAGPARGRLPVLWVVLGAAAALALLAALWFPRSRDVTVTPPASTAVPTTATTSAPTTATTTATSAPRPTPTTAKGKGKHGGNG